MSRFDKSSYALIWKRESDRAICVNAGTGEKDFWLPKSQIAYADHEEHGSGEVLDVEVPEWLAEEKGLI